MPDHLRPDDTLCVRKPGRLGRFVEGVLTITKDLCERGIGVHTLTGEGKFFFIVMAAFSHSNATLSMSAP